MKADGLPILHEVEQCVIGCAILSSKAYHVIKSVGLDSKWFGLPSHEELWLAIEAEFESSPEMDFVLLKKRLEQRQTLNDVGGMDYLIQCVDRVPSATNAKSYAESLADNYARRLAIIACRTALNELESPESTKAITEKLSGATSNALNLIVSSQDSAVADIMSGNVNRFLSTGIEELDRMVLGYKVGDLNHIFGTTGGGKTVLASQAILQHIANGGHPVVISTEVSDSELLARLVRMVTGIKDVSDARSQNKVEYFRHAASWIRSNMSVLCQRMNNRAVSVTLPAICGAIKASVSDRPGLVVIDLCDKLRHGTGATFDQQKYIVQRLSEMAIASNSAIICVTQQSWGRDKGEPAPSGTEDWKSVAALSLWTGTLKTNDEGKPAKPYKWTTDADEAVEVIWCMKRRAAGARTGILETMFDQDRQVKNARHGHGFNIEVPDPFELAE